jgi:hypothetical protein
MATRCAHVSLRRKRALLCLLDALLHCLLSFALSITLFLGGTFVATAAHFARFTFAALM